MTEQELMQEALEWREHIAKLAADCSDQELFRKRLATFDWLIKQAERVHELEQQNKRYRKYLELIKKKGVQGKIIGTGEIILSDEAFLAEKALEGEE